MSAAKKPASIVPGDVEAALEGVQRARAECEREIDSGPVEYAEARGDFLAAVETYGLAVAARENARADHWQAKARQVGEWAAKLRHELYNQSFDLRATERDHVHAQGQADALAEKLRAVREVLEPHRDFLVVPRIDRNQLQCDLEQMAAAVGVALYVLSLDAGKGDDNGSKT
jgi:hypothetical protein